eukprot:snap_masked-scaffold_5-processed-gene-20.68-mRNA-1 protein AED:1.00 eAED:1.00 QI:0/0/0/0/1/1/2/0/86
MFALKCSSRLAITNNSNLSTNQYKKQQVHNTCQFSENLKKRAILDPLLISLAYFLNITPTCFFFHNEEYRIPTLRTIREIAGFTVT